MAVDTTQSWQEHTSDGSTAYFSFNFNYDTTRPGTIVVGKRTADNTYSVVDASDYQLIPNASGDGGQIRFIQNPSGSQVIDDIPPAGTIVRIERVSVDTSSATWQIGLEMYELVNLFDRLFRLVQENKGGFDNVIKTFETQHDVSLYEMLATHDNRLFFWDNTNKTITPTDFPKEDVVRCVNGLFFRVSVNQSGIKYLEWSENGSSDWKGIDISSVNALAQDAHDIATQATNAINTHIADTNNPHSVTKAQVGLGNVDNTSDANKPISTATQTALNAKQDTISDLATIRTGASKGATAVQPGDLATVATSGSYNDLSNKPTIGDGTITIKQSGTIKGTFTTNQTGNTEIDLDAGGTGAVSSVNGQTGTVVLTAPDVGAATSAQGAKADTAVQPGDLATVATSGAYSDLIGTPTIPAAQVNSDWNANSGVAQILNKPTIPTVNNSTITITQGGTTKGTFTTNQGNNTTIDIDAGGGSGLNVGDIFLTMRNDNELNGAVECDGSTYNTTDFTGAQSIGQLLADGKVPYVSMAVYASTVASQGWCDKFGWDGAGNVQFKVPTLSAYIWQKLQTSVVGNGTPMRIVDLTQGGTSNFAYKTGNLFGFSDTPTSPGVGSEHPAGVVNDPTNSGLVAGSASDISQQRCMVQLATSATDEALETCTSVLADVAANTAAIAGADYVVESQLPTAQNNYTWYRKYKSGWVEQGGYIAKGAAQANTVTFSIPFAAKDYIPTVTGDWTGNTGAACAVDWSAATTTQMVVTKDGTGMGAFWKSEGMAAS